MREHQMMEIHPQNIKISRVSADGLNLYRMSDICICSYNPLNKDKRGGDEWREREREEEGDVVREDREGGMEERDVVREKDRDGGSEGGELMKEGESEGQEQTPSSD